MKKLVLSTFTLLLFSISVLSQNFRIDLPPGQNKIIIQDARPNLDGSPFLYEDWQNGTIYFHNGDTIKTIMLRYNVYKNEMQYLNEEKAYAIGCPENIKEIIIGAHSFIYLNYSDEGKPSKGFFEVLSKGKTNLLLLHYPVILPANFNIALNSGNKNDQLSLKSKYYLKSNEIVVEIDKRGKNYISVFAQKEAEIQRYVKDKGLSFRKENDLITLTNFVNSLN